MKTIKTYVPLYKKVVLFLLLLGMTACTQLPKETPVEKKPVAPPPVVAPDKEIPSEPETQVSMTDILLAEASKFKAQGNYQDALFVYNQALSSADEGRVDEILEAIEVTLLATPASVIQSFLDIKNIKIPNQILLFWYGINLALENEDLKAKQVFTTFLFEYPDHPYAQDAADMLATIKESLFKRDTIGCMLPLSGKYAVFGKRALTGIQMALQTLSEKYNNKFNLVIYDTQADPQKAVEGVRYLNEKKAVAIVGPLLTVAEAGIEAEKLQIPMIALTQKSDFPMQGEYLFSNFITPQMQAQTLGAYLFRELNIKKVAILYPDEKYGRTYLELFWDVVDEYDAQVVGAEPYDGKKTDFTEPIQKLTGAFYPVPDAIKEKEREALDAAMQMNQEFMTMDDGPALPVDTEAVSQEDPADDEQDERGEEEEKIEIDFEALFIPDSPSKVNLILPQLAFNDATGMHIVGTNLWHHKSILKDAKGYNKRAVITDGFFADSQNPVTARFAEQYKQIFNKTPQFLEAIAYDCAVILYSTAQDPAVDSRATLKEALKDNRIFEGVTGHTFFDEEGRAKRQLFLITIKRGKFVEISR